MRGQKGITLVALVITIIVLLILAGVGISMALRPDGIFNKAQQAVNEYNNAVREEEDVLTEYINYIDTQFEKLNNAGSDEEVENTAGEEVENTTGE